MKKLWIIVTAIAISGLPSGSAYAQEVQNGRTKGPAVNYSESFGQPHTYPGRPIMRNHRTGNHGSPIFSGSGFGPNYNPNGMSGLNANGNTGVRSGPGLGTVTPGWRVPKNP